MKMELIQPFINAADAVLAQGLQSPMSIGNLSMEQEAYRRKGVAALVAMTGDIEGRIVFDLDPQTAVRVASHFAGAELPESDDLVRETVCELANQVIGNAVTALNDQGFHFRVHPPVLHTSEHGPTSSEDTEALVICFETDQRQRVHEYRPALQRRVVRRTGGSRRRIADVGLRPPTSSPRIPRDWCAEGLEPSTNNVILSGGNRLACESVPAVERSALEQGMRPAVSAQGRCSAGRKQVPRLRSG